MCTSIVVNKKKTIVGWNLDILDMEYRVRPAEEGVYIEINDPQEGWLSLFGANARGDFVGMPTCWPFDARSDPKDAENADDRSDPKGPENADARSNPAVPGEKTGQSVSAAPGENVIMLDIDLLLQKKTLQEIREIADTSPVYSIPGVTFMSALSDGEGNVLHVIPGQGNLYYEKPEYKILTNFSPFKQDTEKHPWMGWDRYQAAEAMLRKIGEDFDVKECFGILRAVAQEVCPTVVSMVYDVTERTVYWCENRDWENPVLSCFWDF